MPVASGRAWILAVSGAGHARRGAQRQGRGASGSDVDGLRAQQIGEERARALEQLVHLDVALAGDLHRLPDRLRRARPADRGACANRVDRAPHPELPVVVDCLSDMSGLRSWLALETESV